MIWKGERALAETRKDRKGAVTIHDVARHAGVSPMTVSRVVNSAPGVRESTRKTVMAAVEALGYSPNAAARSLARQGSGRIGLLYSNPSASYLTAFLVGALDGAQKTGVQLMIEKCDPDPDSERAAVARLVAGGASGVILPSPHGESPAALADFKAAGVAVVAVATGRFRSEVSAVRIDEFAAAAEMARHLLALGHRRIGFIKGAMNQSASDERLQGFQSEMRAAHPAAEALIEDGAFTYRSGLEAAERLLSLPDRPTAIFASNDDMAAGALTAAHRLGLDVPGELTLVGFDDTAIATAVWPELTTIRQPVAEMAETAVRMLSEDIRGRNSTAGGGAADRLVGHRLVVRGSCGPVRV